jgi:hypothetical protein
MSMNLSSPQRQASTRPRPFSTGCARAPAQHDASAQARQFAVMQAAFGWHGGWARGDELAGRLREHCGQPVSTLARWIVAREVISVTWQGDTLLPLFQFDRSTWQPRAGVRQVVAALRDVCDDWALALWFARPNAWLCDASPVDRVGSEPRQVLYAAQADRVELLG